jgi:hypothetical protein
MGIVNEDDLPPACPFCKNTSRLSPNPNGGMREIKILEGPFFSYRRREKELYFDLEKKYAKCSSCGEELEIVDFQVMVELLASMLPPESARTYSFFSGSSRRVWSSWILRMTIHRIDEARHLHV